MGVLLSRKRLRLIAAFWILTLTAVSLQPYRPHGESQSAAHPIIHIAMFGIAALLLLAPAESRKGQWMAAFGVVALALFIETAQHLMYKNVLEWWDVRDDIIGLLIAVALNRWTRIGRLLIADQNRADVSRPFSSPRSQT